MSGSVWPPYPPCASGACADAPCCGLGKAKFRWPELVGSSGAKAKAVIEKETPFVKVVFLPPGRVAGTDFCCNRVYVVVNPSDNVVTVPIIG